MSEQIRRKPDSPADKDADNAVERANKSAADNAAAKASGNAANNTPDTAADNTPDTAADNAHAHSSFGETSLSVTPKDVDDRDASAQDITERHLQSDNSEEKQQEMLDEAIDLTFPASDPPATTGGVTRIEVPKSTATP